jgi:hypothetical protein
VPNTLSTANIRGALEFINSVGVDDPPPLMTMRKPRRPTVINVKEMARGMVLRRGEDIEEETWRRGARLLWFDGVAHQERHFFKPIEKLERKWEAYRKSLVEKRNQTDR